MRVALASGVAVSSIFLLPPTGHAGFSGANGRIAFASEGTQRLYTVDPSGRRLRRIPTSGTDPAWAPDGKSIAFTRRAVDGQSGVFTIRPDGSRLKRVTPPNLQALEPAWSPAGDELVVTVAPAGDGVGEDLYRVPVRGGQPIRLTALPGYEFMASWSPDAGSIAFVLADPLLLTADIYTIRPDGSGLMRITNTPLDSEFAPSWSSDGQSLVFERYRFRDNQADLHTISLSSGVERRLTNTKWDENWPSFSPDGTRVLFGSNRDGDWDVYTMRPNSRGLRKLTHNLSDERVADWQAVRG